MRDAGRTDADASTQDDRAGDGTEAPADPAPPADARGRTPLIAAAVGGTLALLLILGGVAWSVSRAPRAVNVASSGASLIGGPFRMTDQDGRPVDQRILDGKWSAVFFGYTYCPDTCPLTLQRLGAATARLGAKAGKFQVVFVSVDPGRDTPAQMKLYLSNQGFPRRAWGLTGTPRQVADMAHGYRVFYARHGTGDDYTMDHSAAVYLMDPHGDFVKPLDETQGPDAMARQIGEAMAG